MKLYIEKLEREGILTEEEFVDLIANRSKEDEECAALRARAIADSIYGKNIYIRGLIEFTNYCKNNCLYCGIQNSNRTCQRYRLSHKDIVASIMQETCRKCNQKVRKIS